MKAAKVITKIIVALAAIAGAVYVIATYGNQIVAWCKKVLASLPCCECKCECSCDSACEAEAEEVAEVEMTVSYMPDDYNKGEYQALEVELTGDVLNADNWMTDFDSETAQLTSDVASA